MYQNASALFDTPEFPTLRRIKPLPKRRRTSMMGTTPESDEVLDNPTIIPSFASLPAMPGPNATAEELMVHVDTLSQQLALQSYYMPILGGVQDILRGAVAGAQDVVTSAEAANLANGYGGDDQGEGDYIDHLQQPGNTKKRKVPANTPGGQAGVGGRDSGSTLSGGEDDTPVVKQDVPEYSIHVALLARRKDRMSAVTRAGLQHKETLKTRKRQLAAVLGALSHGDTLALDQALSTHYPFATPDPTKSSGPPKIRRSKRKVVRLAREAKAALRLRHPDKIGLPTSEFKFVCPSATAERLIATKEEVEVLRSKFETELARQASKAARLAASGRSKSGRQKRSAAERGQQHRIQGTKSGEGDQVAQFSDQASTLSAGAKSRTGKKKKRSALANASNPHHLRNYVPSRLPSSGGQTNHVSAQDIIGPSPIRFLSAEVPPRRRRREQANAALPQLVNPADEWICAFCEYDLFYGDEQLYRRAIRKRKKILRRRQRARERASAAASGRGTAKVPEKDGAQEDYDAGFDAPAPELGNMGNRQPKSKGATTREGGLGDGTG